MDEWGGEGATKTPLPGTHVPERTKNTRGFCSVYRFGNDDGCLPVKFAGRQSLSRSDIGRSSNRFPISVYNSLSCTFISIAISVIVSLLLLLILILSDVKREISLFNPYDGFKILPMRRQG